MIDQYDVQGNLIWSVPLSGKLAVHAMEADASGNVYIGGTYLETIYIGANDSLTNANGGLWENYFLISFGANGTMRYKRNLNLTYPQIQNISAIKVDQNSSVWFAMQLSLRHVFIKTDAIGNDVDSVHIDNSRLCESFSFDGAGNMFLAAGATRSKGTITLAAGTGTATVASGSVCVCTDTTANASVKCAVATTTLTATGTGTDVIAYMCW